MGFLRNLILKINGHLTHRFKVPDEVWETRRIFYDSRANRYEPIEPYDVGPYKLTLTHFTHSSWNVRGYANDQNMPAKVRTFISFKYDKEINLTPGRQRLLPNGNKLEKKQSIRFHRKILFRVKNDNNQENFSKKNDLLKRFQPAERACYYTKKLQGLAYQTVR